MMWQTEVERDSPQVFFPKTIIWKFIAGAMLLLVCALPLLAQGGERAPVSNPWDIGTDNSSGGGSAVLMLYIRDQYGESPVSTPIIRVDSVTFGTMNLAPPRPINGGWELAGLVPGEEYDIDVTVVGYKEAHKFVMVPQGTGGSGGGMADMLNEFVYLKPLNGDTSDSLAPNGAVLAPQAEKEVQHALKDLRSEKLPSAEKHLDKALRAAPGNAYVNYLLGMCYLRGDKLPLAKASLEKSVAADGKQAPALLALGMVNYRQADYPGAIQLLGQAVQLDPTAWRADWMLASSFLHVGEFDKARDFSEKALEIGKASAVPVELFLGEAEAEMGDRAKAADAFEAYVKAAPNDPGTPKIRGWVEDLRKPQPAAARPAAMSAALDAPSAAAAPAKTVAALSAAVPAPAVELPPKANWAPPDIDSVKPSVVSASACSLPRLMAEAGKSAEDFVSDLQKFSATEQYQSVDVKRDAQLETPESSVFDYLLVLDSSQPRFPMLREYRQLVRGVDPPVGSIADDTAPALALAFHPDFRKDFNWTCEGLGDWDNQPAWVVRFEQKPDKPVARLQLFDTGQASRLVPLKGLAWISKNGGHVIHLETDMTKPLAAVELEREHFVIDYEPVMFPRHKVELWLPENVDVYLQYQNHYLHHYHRYSNFQLFWVGESQKIGQPKETTQKN